MAGGAASPMPDAHSDTPDSFGIYVHFPWCLARCRYCAFATSARHDPPVEAWARGVLAEWERRRRDFPREAESLYFGGGTPSLAPAAVLGLLVRSLPLAPGAEVTVEVNPASVDEAGIAMLVAAGVNRVSLGVQTFDDRQLATLGRLHDAADARRLARALPASGLRSWSMDLMFALPGQRMAGLQADLDALAELDPPHVSLYGLTFEPGTPLEQLRRAGTVRPPPDRRWRRDYDHIVRTLLDRGHERYEVSNFARPGHRSRHNEAVWRGGHYAGLGPAAHGYAPDGRRAANPPDADAWLAGAWDPGRPCTPHEAAIDHVLTTLRHVDGLDLRALQARTGHTIDPVAVARLQGAGLLSLRAGRLALDLDGYPLADGIVAALCDALTEAA